jgi:hypothetical protein
MPAVVGWWQLPEDEEEFIEYVSKTGDVVAVASRYMPHRSDLEAIPVSEIALSGSPGSCALGLRHLIFKRGISELKKDGGVLFSLPRQADFAMYDRCRFREGVLVLLNLYAEWSFLTDDYSATIEKDPEFKAWATKLFAWVRRHTPERVDLRGFPYRATKRVAEAVREGRIRVELY